MTTYGFMIIISKSQSNLPTGIFQKYSDRNRASKSQQCQVNAHLPCILKVLYNTRMLQKSNLEINITIVLKRLLHSLNRNRLQFQDSVTSCFITLMHLLFHNIHLHVGNSGSFQKWALHWKGSDLMIFRRGGGGGSKDNNLSNFSCLSLLSHTYLHLDKKSRSVYFSLTE